MPPGYAGWGCGLYANFALRLPPPNRRTQKCLGGHQNGASRAPQADYRGPRTVTIIMARTMGTNVRLLGENDRKGQNAEGYRAEMMISSATSSGDSPSVSMMTCAVFS